MHNFHRRFFNSYGWGIVSVLTGLAIWEVVARYLVSSKLFLAPPSQVLFALGTLWRQGILQHHIAISALEFTLGYVIACVAGVVIGYLMATWTRSKQALQPWVSGLYATPLIALAPLFILWFGIGILSKVVVVVLLVLFPVIVNTEDGLRQCPRSLIETVQSFSANGWQVFFKVSLPAALPSIFTGLRLGIGRALLGVVVAEQFGARAGIGQMIQQAAETFNMPDLFAGVVILAASGVAITSGFVWLEKRLIPWSEDQ